MTPQAPRKEFSMKDYAFYNVGCHDARGVRGLMVMVRRLMRRILRPFFLRQAELFQHLAGLVEDHEHRVYALRIDQESLKHRHDAMIRRQDEMAARQDEQGEQLHTTMAFGWDYVALVRRLATLEDQVAALTGSAVTPGDEGEAHPSIL